VAVRVSAELECFNQSIDGNQRIGGKMKMTWEKKFAALKSLAGDFNVSLRMRTPGDWYVDVRGIEVADHNFLTSPTHSGKTPSDAVERCWKEHTELPTGSYLVKNAMLPERIAFKWNGYMWGLFDEKQGQP
jgi:hypothetical protein